MNQPPSQFTPEGKTWAEAISECNQHLAIQSRIIGNLMMRLEEARSVEIALRNYVEVLHAALGWDGVVNDMKEAG